MDNWRSWVPANERHYQAMAALDAEAKAEEGLSLTGQAAAYGERVAALYRMPLNDLAGLLVRLGGNPYDDPTRWGIAQAIIRIEDQFPWWIWEDTVKRAVLLSNHCPPRDSANIGISGQPRLGTAWHRADQRAKALTNVASWNDQKPWRLILINTTADECEDDLARELDESPF